MSPMSDHQPQEQQDGDAARAVSSPHLPLSQQPLFTSPGTRRLIIPTATLLSEEEGATTTATATATGPTSVSRASQGGAATPAESILDGEEENHGGCFGPSLMQATSPTTSSAAGPVAGLQQPHPLGDSRTLWPGAPAATLPRPLPRSSMGLSWASAFKLPTEWAQAHASRCSDTSTEVVPYTDDALPTQVCCNKLCFCDGYKRCSHAALLCSVLLHVCYQQEPQPTKQPPHASMTYIAAMAKQWLCLVATSKRPSFIAKTRLERRSREVSQTNPLQVQQQMRT